MQLTAPGLATYLKSLSPSFSFATLQSGLALFAVVVIVRFCAITTLAWFRRLRGVDRPYAVLQHRQQQRSLWSMDEKAPVTGPPVGGEKEVDDLEAAFVEEEQRGRMSSSNMITNHSSNHTNHSNMTLSIVPNWENPAILMSRPPPAPPLTPPELSTAVFTFEDRPRPGDDSFMSQPNPDYMSSTMSTSASPSPALSMPRRRSYNKTLPIGVPVPVQQQQSSGILSDFSDPADLTFSPSSYPPTSPLLPPAPPSAGGLAAEMDVQGQIIGVLDSDGAGWTRHTRVYGGGVCLACAASGRSHEGEGGFYGATVRPEEMR